jgi:hypothetical protein
VLKGNDLTEDSLELMAANKNTFVLEPFEIPKTEESGSDGEEGVEGIQLDLIDDAGDTIGEVAQKTVNKVSKQVSPFLGCDAIYIYSPSKPPNHLSTNRAYLPLLTYIACVSHSALRKTFTSQLPNSAFVSPQKFFNVIDLHATLDIDFELLRAKKVSKKAENDIFVSGKDFKAIVARMATCSGTVMFDDLLPAYQLKLKIGDLQVAGFKQQILQHSYSTLVTWGNPRQKHHATHQLAKTNYRNAHLESSEAMVKFQEEVNVEVPQLLIKVYQRPEKLGGSSEALIEHNPSGMADEEVFTFFHLSPEVSICHTHSSSQGRNA